MAEGEAIERLDLVLNGARVSVTTQAGAFLLDVIRDELGLTGAKRSCDVQVCGSCTVLVDGEPVSACTFLAHDARGREVLTIEGLSRGTQLHPLQQAFLDHGALQCGFCTPAMVLTASALLRETPHPTRDEICAYLDGALCRCTGYQKIIEAVQHAADASARSC